MSFDESRLYELIDQLAEDARREGIGDLGRPFKDQRTNCYDLLHYRFPP